MIAGVDPENGDVLSKEALERKLRIDYENYKANGGELTYEDWLAEGMPEKVVAKGPLDWGGTDPQGLSRKDHVRRHGIDDPSRSTAHGVFNGDPINLTADAWKRAKELGIEPQIQGNRLVYDIPYPNAGIQGGNPGLPGHGQTLNTIRIVTEAGSNRVITAFPR